MAILLHLYSGDSRPVLHTARFADSLSGVYVTDGRTDRQFGSQLMSRSLATAFASATRCCYCCCCRAAAQIVYRRYDCRRSTCPTNRRPECRSTPDKTTQNNRRRRAKVARHTADIADRYRTFSTGTEAAHYGPTHY